MLNELGNISSEVAEIKDIAPTIDTQIQNEWLQEAKYFEYNDNLEPFERGEIHKEAMNECIETVQEIFSPEVLNEWATMNEWQHKEIVSEYAKAISENLNINFQGVIFEKMDNGCMGLNCGDGYLHLNENLIKDSNPNIVAQIADTIAHEAEHQFQCEAVSAWLEDDTEKFGVPENTLETWAIGKKNYTQPEVDYEEYYNNPIEIDARSVGERAGTEVKNALRSI